MTKRIQDYAYLNGKEGIDLEWIVSMLIVIINDQDQDAGISDLCQEGGRGSAPRTGRPPLPRRHRRRRVNPLLAAPLRGRVQLERGSQQPVLLAPAPDDPLHHSDGLRVNHLPSHSLDNQVPSRIQF